jgi:ubiquinone/menaquinone biosynthesis C-methylase UbiE
MAEMVRLEKLLCRSAPWRFWTRRFVLPWALQGIRPSGDGLEIGAGAGTMAQELLRAFPDLRLNVTDFDESMLDSGRAELDAFGPRAEIGTADATGLPFEDGRFDHVFSFIMLHHVMEWEKAIGEALRVLKPGGWLIGYDILESLPFRLFHRLENAEVRLMRLAALEAELDHHALERAVLSKAPWGPVVRFRIRK